MTVLGKNGEQQHQHDGLGACIVHCPEDAITIEQREAAEFDEQYNDYSYGGALLQRSYSDCTKGNF
jgi:ferredoxin